ncbi:MAG TPA: HD domain-containing phosphohydrolase [Thermoanaerobaculia bacterium]|jgi:HD-GYP domain-containing protein (c-di-GMP phosphodiesterase class II)|nr:HD domain-containing phosphohydrolase [Thermoanaerobaculia bacterium]
MKGLIGLGGEENNSMIFARESGPVLEPGGDVHRRLAEYERLFEIGVRLAGSLDLETILEMALENAEEVCRAETSSIWEVDEESGELFFRVVRGAAAGEIRDLRVPFGQGIVGSVAQSGRAEVINDVAADPRWRGDAQPVFQTRALLAVPLLAHGSVIGVLQLLNPVGKDHFTAEDLRRMQLFAGVLAHPLQNARLYAVQQKQFFNMVTALAETLEKKDPYTGGHVRRVVSYSLLLGAQMGLSRSELRNLWLAATLHDIGKIGIPDRILGKPAPLDPDEIDIMKRHTVFGAEIVSHLATPGVLPGVRSHHERIDGKGYPDGLAGDDIPLAPRIIAVADTFDAMTTSRPYRSGLEAERAAREILAGSGTQFHPAVVEAFRLLFEQGKFGLPEGESVLRDLDETMVGPRHI